MLIKATRFLNLDVLVRRGLGSRFSGFELYPRIDRSSTLVNSAVLGVPVVAVYVLVFYFVGIASSAMVCPVEVSTFL